ncbi:MAG: mandelate racemase/muconate lactonizing enzyme family protein [Halobacteriaceae archaeon]
MEITDFEVIPLEHELEEGRSFGSSRGKTGTRFATLVRLETGDGTVGWGEAFAPPRTVATLVEELLADAVLGMDPYEVESFAEGALTGWHAGYHFGGHAFVSAAVSGVDLACWDVIGKAAGEPVAKLLGGRARETVVPYASTGYVTEWGQDIAEPMREAADEGFEATKIKIGRGVEDDVERVATAREHLGDDAHVMVDYNGNYDPKRVVRSVEALSEYDLTWIEEPVPAENESGYRQIRDRVDVPVAAGEAHYGRFEFKELIDERLVDVVQPNLGRVGGLSEARFVADLATTENVSVRPHVWNSGVGVAAALQYAASLPDYPHSENVPEPMLFEFDRSENPLRHEILETPFDPTGGRLDVPQAPGLGIEVDEDAVERYRVD